MLLLVYVLLHNPLFHNLKYIALFPGFCMRGCYKPDSSLQKMIGCFNHWVVTLIADMQAEEAVIMRSVFWY